MAWHQFWLSTKAYTRRLRWCNATEPSILSKRQRQLRHEDIYHGVLAKTSGGQTCLRTLQYERQGRRDIPYSRIITLRHRLPQSQVCVGPILAAALKKKCTIRYHINSFLQISRQALHYLLQMEMLVA
ncbi:hypothetical protein B5807_01883 [Epicoccum nigrum]|uniref:Uncharacterized protein n=1 Tax=Epicoccum nigrum TaxID=105696 RepID=A0A1Y2M9K6_EPING|nr:hypothetical protein B5807_01883 [Epicoccum nigrum]